jgi:ubiquinone/menaquinone biosynthesis methyltransferase
MSKETRKMFEGIAPTYDRINRVLSMNNDMKWRRNAVAMMAKGGFSPKRILDLCAGTGDFTLAVKERFPEAEVVLVDFAKPMLKIAREKLGQASGIEIITGDAQSVPFCDMSFDAVLCGFGLRNLDDPQKGLHEMGRLLNPGGRAVVLDFFKPEGAITKFVHRLYVKTVVPRVGGGLSKDPAAYRYLPDSADRFFAIEDARKRMGGANIGDVEAQSMMFGVVHSLVGTRR